MNKQHLHTESEDHCSTTSASPQQSLSRRNLLSGASVLAAALMGGASLTASAEEHHSDEHGQSHAEVLAAARNCSSAAQKCLAHCLNMVQAPDGDRELAKCARKTNEMSTICEDFAHQLAVNSPYVESLAKVCRDACADCEKLCRRKEAEHAACKECAEACAQVIAAIDNM